LGSTNKWVCHCLKQSLRETADVDVHIRQVKL
jgi:hypothetical protein